MVSKWIFQVIHFYGNPPSIYCTVSILSNSTNVVAKYITLVVSWDIQFYPERVDRDICR